MENLTPGVEVEAGSPSVSSGIPVSTGPAPVSPVGTATPEVQPPFHQHPRFQSLIAENRSLKEASQQLNHRLAQLEELQTTAGNGGLNADEQRQYAEAATALKRIFAADPELKALFESRNYLPRLAEGYQSVQRLTQAQAQAQQETARAHIAQLASKEGLPSDKKWLTHLTRLVAGAAMGLEDGNGRYDRGDLSVLDEAFDAVKGDFLALMRQGTVASTLQTKNKLKSLPPAPRGGAVGPEAPTPIEPGKEREFTQNLHKRGLAMLKEKLTG
jgi:hypothetical protein